MQMSQPISQPISPSISPRNQTLHPGACKAREPRHVTIKLHGALDRFGGPHRFTVHEPAHLIAGLVTQISALDPILRRGQFALYGQFNATDTNATDTGATDTNGTDTNAATPWHAIDGPALFQPVIYDHYHLMPVLAGASRSNGKVLLGLTLLGLTFVPGVHAGTAASANSGDMMATMGRRLLGGAATWLVASTSSDALAPQIRHPAGQDESAVITASAPVGEGAPIPLIYGRVRVQSPPVVSAGLSVKLVPLP